MKIDVHGKGFFKNCFSLFGFFLFFRHLGESDWFFIFLLIYQLAKHLPVRNKVKQISEKKTKIDLE